MTILAAVSGEREQDHVVEVGHDLATTYGDDLVVLHVMAQEQFDEIRDQGRNLTSVAVGGSDEDGLAYMTSRHSAPNYDLEKAMADAAKVAEDCVSNTLDAESGTVRTEGRVGDPSTQIVEEADRVDARFVVVGGRKRSPTGKAIFGSVSQSVILNSQRPVVAVVGDE